ncbi:hypothetical protein ILUMI_20499 [Ignelater luminosus]|uniref:THAP-type domain-containing protein n=2 Tax=Ignelater luminosus TaxID=2038154 RepID=A0A8K0G4I6_IGNLU|nr:hypothetical protein ILUMI_20499 [Ignelater luminosus]
MSEKKSGNSMVRSYQNCNHAFYSNSTQENLKFFKFAEDPEMCKRSLYACGRKDLSFKKSTSALYNTHRLCSKHFKVEMFVNPDVMDSLLTLAVPESYQKNIITQVYMFLSNEYRYFPIRYEINLCKAFEVNYAGMRNGLKCGNFAGCPLQTGKIYHVCNWMPDENKLPPAIPTGKYKIRMTLMYELEEAGIIDCYADIVNSMYIFKK